jgi:hypothetical protein
MLEGDGVGAESAGTALAGTGSAGVGLAGATAGVPQLKQNFASSGNWVPQLEQNFILVWCLELNDLVEDWVQR